MNLYYCNTDIGNFGDDLNPWLWNKVFPNLFDNCSEENFIAIGTILDKRIDNLNGKIIFGSGVRDPKYLPKVDKSWKIYAVRGPLSAKALGISEKFSVTDPAVIVRNYYQTAIPKVHDVSYMPYFRSAITGRWETICDSVGMHYIDPRAGVDSCLLGIAQSKYLITEAMHGAIVADAFRVPWSPVKAFSHIHEKDVSIFKWNDWLKSLEITFMPKEIPNLWKIEDDIGFFGIMKKTIKETIVVRKIEKIIKTQEFHLSSEKILKQKISNYNELIEEFRKDRLSNF